MEYFKENMILLGCGDSWCWGDELIDKELYPKYKFGDDLGNLKNNDTYREKNRYLNMLGQKLGTEQIHCLAFRGSSNDAIFRTLVDYLANEKYLFGRSTKQLFVSIGWTSPERREFYFKEKWGSDNWMPVGPWQLDHDGTRPYLCDFQNLLFEHFWHTAEYMNRWTRQLYFTELLLKSLNISYVMHQAFYHSNLKTIDEWDSNDLKNAKDYISKQDDLIYKSLDNIKFIGKNDTDMTFHNYILNQVNGDTKKVFAEWHPNELGHKLWADFLYKYIRDNNLWTE